MKNARADVDYFSLEKRVPLSGSERDALVEGVLTSASLHAYDFTGDLTPEAERRIAAEINTRLDLIAAERFVRACMRARGQTFIEDRELVSLADDIVRSIGGDDPGDCRTFRWPPPDELERIVHSTFEGHSFMNAFLRAAAGGRA